LDSKTPPWLKYWKGDGTISRTGSRPMADAIAAVGLPTVELRATRVKHNFPFVGVDNRVIGEMVTQHLLEAFAGSAFMGSKARTALSNGAANMAGRPQNTGLRLSNSF
jgi:LacI family transcriptional regulator